MTREEAISMTREDAANLLDILRVFDAPGLTQAIKMAKDALREQPLWISVEERLPENGATVLVLAQRKRWIKEQYIPLVSMGFYTDGKHNTEESSYCWNDLTEYVEEADAYMIPEGWWENVNYGEEFSAISDFVTHWMPLPEPPKEEPNHE